jgi:hypothetical protein
VSVAFTINTDIYLSAFNTVLNKCAQPFIKVTVGGTEYNLTNVTASVADNKITFTGTVDINVGGNLTAVSFGLSDCAYASYSISNISITDYTRLTVKIEITVNAKQLT